MSFVTSTDMFNVNLCDVEGQIEAFKFFVLFLRAIALLFLYTNMGAIP